MSSCIRYGIFCGTMVRLRLFLISFVPIQQSIACHIWHKTQLYHGIQQVYQMVKIIIYHSSIDIVKILIYSLCLDWCGYHISETVENSHRLAEGIMSGELLKDLKEDYNG